LDNQSPNVIENNDPRKDKSHDIIESGRVIVLSHDVYDNKIVRWGRGCKSEIYYDVDDNKGGGAISAGFGIPPPGACENVAPASCRLWCRLEAGVTLNEDGTAEECPPHGLPIPAILWV